MNFKSIRFGRILGISLEMHITFILFIAAIALYFLFAEPKMFVPMILLFVFLFASVFFHELVHSIVAISKGVKVKRIILLPIGGIAMTEKMPKKPIDEFFISVAGPLFNFAVAAAVLLVSAAFPFMQMPSLNQILSMGIMNAILSYPLFSLLYVNLILGAFNLFLPALPLDGGRVWRSLLSIKYGAVKATAFVSKISTFFAIALFIFGFLIGDIIISIIAVFIYFGANSENEAAQISEVLKGENIEKIINKKPFVLSGEEDLKKAFELMEKKLKTSFLVETKKGFAFISAEMLKEAKKENWEKMKVKDAAREIPAISLHLPASEIMTLFVSHNYPLLPIKEKDKLVGIIEFEEIAKLFKLLKAQKL